MNDGSQFRNLSMARFASLIAPVPADTDTIFRLSADRSFLGAFGYIMILSLVVELLIQPHLSRAIDRINRKGIQMINQTLFSVSALSAGLLTAISGHVEAVLLIMLLIIEVYYTVSYRVYASVAQSVIKLKDAGNYNGVSEILSQSPVIMGGLLSALLWNIVPLQYIFLASGMAGMLFLLPLSYVRNAGAQVSSGHSSGSGISRGHRMGWMTILFVFLLNMPYVAVVSGNYLKLDFRMR